MNSFVSKKNKSNLSKKVFVVMKFACTHICQTTRKYNATAMIASNISTKWNDFKWIQQKLKESETLIFLIL